MIREADDASLRLLPWPNREKLDGKVALITGGGGGMGGAQARLFGREGAAVAVADLFLDKANVVADEIKAAGGRAIGVQLDVQRSDQWAAAVEATESAFGPVSILCNNAGANFRVSFDEQTEEMWQVILGTILTGSFLGTKAVVGLHAPRRRRRKIVKPRLPGIGSRPGGGSPAYGAAKMGLVGLTRSTASSYARDGIRAACWCRRATWIPPSFEPTRRTAPTMNGPVSTTRKTTSAVSRGRRSAACKRRTTSPRRFCSWCPTTRR